MPDGNASFPLSDISARPQARAVGGGTEILLYGSIGGDVTARGFADVLASIPARAPLTLRVNSGGGDVFEGMAIFNMLQRRGGSIVAVVDGIAASMGSLIAMAGSQIVMPANAWMMIHNPILACIGDATFLSSKAGLLAGIAGQMAAIYSARTGTSIDQVNAMMTAETWLDADQAVALGFATEKAAAVDAAASIDLSRFTNPPAAVAALFSKGTFMPGSNTPTQGTATPQAATTPTQPPQAAQRATSAPVAAALCDLQAIAQRARLDGNWIVAQLAAGATLDQARDAAIDAVAAAQAIPRIDSANPSAVLVTDRPWASARDASDAPPVFAPLADALYSRLTSKPPTAAAREFRGASLAGIARLCLEARGERVSRFASDTEVFDRAMGSNGAHTTSDFPNLLQGTGNRVLLEQYQHAQSPIRTALCLVREAPDYRALNHLRLGDPPALLAVAEDGEITYGSTKESKEAYSIGLFGRSIGISRQALINDDLGAFKKGIAWQAVAAADTEANQLVALLNANSGMGPTMGDGVSCFHANHGNTGSGALTVANVGTARATMRKQTAMDGVSPVAATPKYILVSPDNETNADQVVFGITPAQSSNVNPFAGQVQKLCDPRLTGVPWYLFGDPNITPVFEVAYLHGSQGPILRAEEDFDTFGIKWRCSLEFGCGIIGWRGAFRSTGV